MPPRHTYWTIILDDKPTAFRAHTQEELLPTLKQLQSKHPDAVMKWFARGRLWHSQEEERMAAALKRHPPAGDRRPPTWRPGGTHEDPRERFKVPRDEKRRRFASKLRRERAEGEPPAPPKGDAPPAAPRPARREWPRGDRDARRPGGWNKGGGPGGRPSGPGSRPSGPGGRPSGPGGRPSGPGGRPSGPGGRPSGPGGRPSGPGGRPSGPGGRPSGPGGRPSGPGGARRPPTGRPGGAGRPGGGRKPGGGGRNR